MKIEINTSDKSLPELLGWINNEKKSGRVAINLVDYSFIISENEYSFYFRRGKLVGEKEQKNILIKLLGLETNIIYEDLENEGWFLNSPSFADSLDNLAVKSTAELIIVGLRELNELGVLENKLPLPEYALEQGIGLSLDKILNEKEKLILDCIDGQTSIRKIAQKTALPLLLVQKTVFAYSVLETVVIVKPVSPIRKFIADKSFDTINEEVVSVDLVQRNPYRLGWREIIVGFTGLFILVLVSLVGGWLKPIEYKFLAYFLRSTQAEEKSRVITVVTVDDSDIQQLGNYPINDAQMAQAINNIYAHSPLAIGIDIYRDIPVEPGHQELQQSYLARSNLVAVEKVVGTKIPAPSILTNKGQVGFSDLVPDSDGVVRRALISLKLDNTQNRLSLGTQLGFIYLKEHNFQLKRNDLGRIQIGEASITPLTENSGMYWGRENFGGYQTLLNYRGNESAFTVLDFTSVLRGEIPPESIEGRLVFIGVIADSVKDLVFTPVDAQPGVPTPGVFVHANVANMLIEAADSKGLPLSVASKSAELCWFAMSGLVGIALLYFAYHFLFLFEYKVPALVVLFVILLLDIGLFWGFGAVAFVLGYWIPIALPIIASSLGTLALFVYYQQDLFFSFYFDRETTTYNRLFFDRYLESNFYSERWQKEYLSLILCRLRDDSTNIRLLRQLGDKLKQTIRRHDLLFRFDRHTLAILLPNTERFEAENLKERIESTSNITCGLGTVQCSKEDIHYLLFQALSEFIEPS